MWYYRLIAVLTALDLIGKSAVEALPEKAFPRELPPGKPLLPKRGRKFEKTALALVLAGGASNLFDRFFRGYVVDYLSLANSKSEHLVFNLGDLFIALGMGLTAALELVRGLKRLISERRQA